MKGLDNTAYLIMYIFSNVVALSMLWASWKKPKIARFIFFLLFTWASFTNWKVATRSSQFYLEYADLSFLNVYKQIIHGWFSMHITEAVGFIATCQALIAVSMLLKGWILKTGGVGAIIFLLAIMPFGVGSAFPCTFIMAVSIFILLKKYDHDLIWKKKQSSQQGK